MTNLILIKNFIDILDFKPIDGSNDVYYKEYHAHGNYIIKVDFNNKKIDYGDKIELGDLTTSNFQNNENFVILECVNRLLEKGYAPENIFLEYKWSLGHREKGKLDILIKKDSKTYLMIECKTWDEYSNEMKKMLKNGSQLFSYYQQDKDANFLCLYTSNLLNEKGYKTAIVKVEDDWKELTNKEEVFNHWNKNFKNVGIFEENISPYNIEIKALTRSQLKELTKEDGTKIFNQFAQILRQNIVSDKSNAFNKIFNLFLCKIVDEDRRSNDELHFQWLDDDTNESLQKRLNDLYKKGMERYFDKNITDISDEEIEDILGSVANHRDELNKMRNLITRLRLEKNPEFAFKEVYDSNSFEENAIVVNEVVELLQPYQIRYTHKQQFLGDFFELLLTTGLKQESGQFFTPTVLAHFILSSIPMDKLIYKNMNDETDFLPYIIDYAAGSGHFLTESMDELQKIIEEIDIREQKSSVQNKINSWINYPYNWAANFVYGIEADYRLVKTAKVSCFLNGDGLATIIHGNGLDNFEKSTEYVDKLKECNGLDNSQFDILVTNPPYSVSAFRNTLKYGDESFELFNKLTEDSKEIECLFVERAKQLLKIEGWAAIILPISILNNDGIYVNTRELILKYFDIKAIMKLGQNAFMATNINTIILFLERKKDNIWKAINNHINAFFNNPHDFTVNNIEQAFSKYVEDVFENATLNDYISLIRGSPNDIIKEEDIFIEYSEQFNNSSVLKNITNKKSFKEQSIDEKEKIISEMFYSKLIDREKNKLLYYFLAYTQEIIAITPGESKKEQEKLLGYKFSNRRGNEGIKFKTDSNNNILTPLYDPCENENKEKINYYIRRAFSGENLVKPDEKLSENVVNIPLKDLIDFQELDFTIAINQRLQTKNNYEEIWDDDELTSLQKIASIGKGKSITQADTEEGDIPVVAGGKTSPYTHNKHNRGGNIISVSASGKYAGFVNYWSDPIFASDCCTIKSKDEEVISTKDLFDHLQSIQEYIYRLQKGQAQGHVYRSDLRRIKIPSKFLNLSNLKEEMK